MVLECRPTCPVCTGDEHRTILDMGYSDPALQTYLERFYGGRARHGVLATDRYRLDRCKGCGLVFQRYVPSPPLLDELYGSWIDHGDPAAAVSAKHFEARRHYAFQVIDLVRFFQRPPSELRFLDYGMGWGNWVDMASAFGCRAGGVELGLHQVVHARDRGVEVVAPDAIEPDTYDFINTEQVFEHLVEPASVGRGLVAALRRGGLLRISVPNGSDIEERLAFEDWEAPKGTSRSLNAVAPLEHLNTFDHGSLQALGRELGLRPLTWPLRVHLDQWQPVRAVLGAIRRRFQPARGTMLLFQRP